MKKLIYESPVIRRAVPFRTMPAVMAGSEYPVSGSAGVGTGGHGVGEEVNFESSTTFNHDWK